MLVEALAVAGGTAVVQAAGTDAWAGFRAKVAQWFARGDSEREQVTLGRLDRAAAALETAGPGDAERVRADQEAEWRTRFETALESLDTAEQRRASDELGVLLAGFAGGRATAIGDDAVAVTGDVSIRAETGGLAAWRMGNVQIGHLQRGSAGRASDAVGPQRPGQSSG